MTDTVTFRAVARLLVEHYDTRPDSDLLDYGPEEQIERVYQAMIRINAVTPLTFVTGEYRNLAGFGEAAVWFRSGETRYFLLSSVAQALGMPLYDATAMAEREFAFCVQDQRRTDEERGDGRLGYDHMREWFDLGLSLILDNPTAKPDANGQRWSFASDWLVSDDRLMLIISKSPWGKEFMDNALPAFGHAARKFFGNGLGEVRAVDGQGNVVEGAFEELFSTDGLTEEEALRRARRGPALPDGAADE